MFKSLKILLVLFLVILLPNNSYSVVSGLSKTGKLIFKSKSVAKTSSGVALTDNVASELLDSSKLNKSIIDKLSKERNVEYLNSIKIIVMKQFYQSTNMVTKLKLKMTLYIFMPFPLGDFIEQI